MKKKFFHGITVRTLALALICLLSPYAQAKAVELYLYKENGMPVYSNRKPENVPYTVVIPGSGTRPALRRPVALAPVPVAAIAPQDEVAATGWAASCGGITEYVMQERAKPLHDIITRHAKMHGVPAALIRAVMRVESCFDPRAVSRLGARGVMQLMPATASELGVRDSFNAEQNIGGGVRYLRKLLQRFNNDARLAVAAYNAGPEAVTKHGGIPPFPETKRYVERVFDAYLGAASDNSAPKKSLS